MRKLKNHETIELINIIFTLRSDTLDFSNLPALSDLEKLIAAITPLGVALLTYLGLKYKKAKDADADSSAAQGVVCPLPEPVALPAISPDEPKPKFIVNAFNLLRIWSCLNELNALTKASSIFVCRAHNGGGIPTHASEFKVSVEYEVLKHNLPVEDSWKNQQVDRPYIEMLIDLFIQKKMLITVSELRDGIFKHFCEAAKYTHIHMTELIFDVKKSGGEREELWYLCANYRAGEFAAATELDAIRAGVTKLKNIFDELVDGESPRLNEM